jgi:hypothetical protein
MDRSIPVFNRVVVDRMRSRNQELHKRTLASIKQRPFRQTHSKSHHNPKAMQLE